MQAEARVTSRSAVAALLDGATPLHAAALRGNPAQIDHLLFCKADPMARTAAGDYPFELVPTCGDKVTGGTACCLQSRNSSAPIIVLIVSF